MYSKSMHSMPMYSMHSTPMHSMPTYSMSWRRLHLRQQNCWQLPDVARDADVALIARACDYTAPGVQIVDVTDALVQLFRPSEKTLRTIAELRKPTVYVDPTIADPALHLPAGAYSCPGENLL